MRRTLLRLVRAVWCAPVAAMLLASTPLHGEELPPAYVPEQQVSGTLRFFGVPLMGMVEIWQEGLRRHHPNLRFENTLDSAAAMAGLYTKVADVGASGREPVLTEYFSFYETFRYPPTEIAVATGAHDVKGGSYGLVVFVHKDNPISQLTLQQLDGIFGSERNGGYDGFRWSPLAARSAREDIRTWGQLGLSGEWANRSINTAGYALTGMAVVFQQKVFRGGDKWNPNYRQFIEGGTKQVADTRLTIQQMLSDLSADKYGIAWTGIAQAKEYPNLKPVALAARPGTPYIAPTRENFANGTYPLNRQVYLFLNRKPGEPLDPKVREFVRYALSREGQSAIAAKNIYFPLPAQQIREQLAKLD